MGKTNKGEGCNAHSCACVLCTAMATRGPAKSSRPSGASSVGPEMADASGGHCWNSSDTCGGHQGIYNERIGFIV